MSQKNDFKAFSISDNANVVSQRLYEESKDLLTGFPPNDVPTHLLNKALRQSSTISSVVANFIATQSGDDVLDDGNVVKLTAQLNRALEQKTTTKVPDASLTQKGVVQLTDVVGNSDTLAVTQKLAQEIINSLREEINISNKANYLPVGTPIPWPTDIPPVGWLQCNGAEFDKAAYPQLAAAYPTGKLPDLRGEFIRGWSGKRGVDNGRKILSLQGDAIRNITAFVQGRTDIANGRIFSGNDDRSGAFLTSGEYGDYVVRSQGPMSSVGARDRLAALSFDASRVVPTANENRPRNVAFNYIVRAA
ncbi:phage protein ydab [Photorhabdus luminescens subsp. luminescens]|uniref:Phage tail fibre repeat-containing protein n=1 Tax=Photorhabdus luminescens TaxID=29488 RepID=A0A1G5QVA0_PHOLU|nr:tail fiber protein [Photorhabdus luminescens]KMW71889.1 phage protein ydab [Photorhabdus luminescens subsp. luminescens]SCZ65480.1 Phage tail fibre repeat-containing protein [Photorhabdus luminescens]